MMGSTGQCQFFVAVVKPVFGVPGKNRQRLHGLDRRTGKNSAFDIAARGNKGAIGIDDRKGAAEDILDPVAARQLGEDGVGVHDEKAPVCSALGTAPSWKSQRSLEPIIVG